MWRGAGGSRARLHVRSALLGVGSDDNGEWHRSSVRLPIGATSTEDVCDTAFDQRFVNEFAARESRKAQMFFLFLIHHHRSAWAIQTPLSNGINIKVMRRSLGLSGISLDSMPTLRNGVVHTARARCSHPCEGWAASTLWGEGSGVRKRGTGSRTWLIFSERCWHGAPTSRLYQQAACQRSCRAGALPLKGPPPSGSVVRTARVVKARLPGDLVILS